MTKAYYNEFDPKAAEWLRQLIKNGDISPGDVDERSITEVTPNDLRGYSRVHFFAGIGTWDYALNQAGWGAEPVWTASLPCQPFSTAGKGLGKSDERHLLPHFIELVRQCKPTILFGEQVPGAIKHGWLDDLYTEMNVLGYEVAANVIPACVVGSPHIRSRLWWCSIRKNVGIKNEEMHEMLISEATNRICEGEAISGRTSVLVQGMQQKNEKSLPRYKQGSHESCCERTKEIESRSRPSVHENVPGQISLENTHRSCQEKGCEIRMGIRSGQLSGSDKREGVEDDMRNVWREASHWSWIGESGKEILQHNIDRQDRSQQGVCLLEHSDSLLGDELRNVNLGRGYSHGSCQIVDWEEGVSNDSSREDKFSFKKESLHSIQSDLFNELEGGDDTSRLKIDANISVGAAHIRQRLYWMGFPYGAGSQQRLKTAEAARYRDTFKPASFDDWICCRDGKYRPIESGIFPLVDRIAKKLVRSGDTSASIDANATQEARAMRLKGYGNAIQAQTAELFIRACMSI